MGAAVVEMAESPFHGFCHLLSSLPYSRSSLLVLMANFYVFSIPPPSSPFLLGVPPAYKRKMLDRVSPLLMVPFTMENLSLLL